MTLTSHECTMNKWSIIARSHTIRYIVHMQRTIRVKLTPSTAQADLLAETSRLFTAAFNAVCRVGWEQKITNGVDLHHATYYPTQANYPALVSDLLIQARVKATEAVKSAFALQKVGRTVGMPQSDACPQQPPFPWPVCVSGVWLRVACRPQRGA